MPSTGKGAPPIEALPWTTIIPRRSIVVAGRPHHVTLARLLRPHHDGRPGFDVLDGLGEGLGGVEVKTLTH